MSYLAADLDLTDAGLGDALAAEVVQRWRYCADGGFWLRWGGTHWARDYGEGIVQEALAVVDEIEGAVDLAGSSAARKAWVNRRSAASLRAQVSMARTTPAIVVMVAQLDVDAEVIATPTGLVDLRRGRLLPHDPARLYSRCTVGRLDAAADQSPWRAFIDQVACGDATLAAWLQRAVGMSLLGDQRSSLAPFCFGFGANGKTTFLQAISYALGTYAGKAAGDLVTASQHDRHPAEIMDLRALRFVVVDELRAAVALDEAKLKRLTGGGVTKARAMGKDFVEFPNTWQMWMDCNAGPTIRGQDDGIWRRLRLVPWRHHVPEADRDLDLPRRLEGMADAIFTWAVEGCVAYLRDGLPVCAAIDAGTRTYRAEQDVVGQWLDDVAEYPDDGWALDAGKWSSTAAVAESARRWCEAQSLHAWSPQRLAQDLRARGCTDSRRGGVRGWQGLEIRAAATAAKWQGGSGTWSDRESYR